MRLIWTIGEVQSLVVKRAVFGVVSARDDRKDERESWWRFKASKPGHRFQGRYRRNQQRSRGRFDLRRFFNVVVGLVIVLVSIFFGWAPGPGWLTSGQPRPLEGKP